jgi:hypothetical protein
VGPKHSPRSRGEAHGTADGFEVGEADVAEFRLAEAEIAEAESEFGVRLERGQ